MSEAARAVLLDVDGTLVDTNYLHVMAWQRAFRSVGLDVPGWRVHRTVGEGGDRFVATAAGDDVEARHGDALRAAHADAFAQLIKEARPLPGARDLVLELKRRGVAVALASSGEAEEVDHYLDLLEIRDALDGWTSSGDVDSSKPAPDLVEAALARAGDVRPALLVGDSVWDGKAAQAAGIGFVAVLTGGISATELRAAGAREVYESAAELAASLDAAGVADLR